MSKSKQMIAMIILVILLLICLYGQAVAQTPVIESFDYPLNSSADTLLGEAGNGWGDGWDLFDGNPGVWHVVDTGIIVYDDLVYPVPHKGYQLTGANPAAWGWQRVYRRLEDRWLDEAGKIYWFSVIYDLSDNFTTSGWALVGFYKDDSTEADGVGHEWGNDSLGLATYNPEGHTGYTMLDGPQWFVVKIVMTGDTMPERVYLWVSPDPSLGEPDTNFADAKSYWSRLNDGFDRIAVHFGGEGVGMSMSVDEIRLGTSWEEVSSDVNALEAKIGAFPTRFKLHQNYPNPFNPTTTISYNLDKPGQVRLTIFDVNGKEIQRLVDEFQKAGSYHIRFSGENLASGVYFYKLQVGGQADMRKMILLR